MELSLLRVEVETFRSEYDYTVRLFKSGSRGLDNDESHQLDSRAFLCNRENATGLKFECPTCTQPRTRGLIKKSLLHLLVQFLVGAHNIAAAS